MISAFIRHHGEENTRLITRQDVCQESGFNIHCLTAIKTQQSVALVNDGGSQMQPSFPSPLNLNLMLLKSIYCGNNRGVVTQEQSSVTTPLLFSQFAPHHLSTVPGRNLIHHFNLLGQSF